MNGVAVRQNTNSMAVMDRFEQAGDMVIDSIPSLSDEGLFDLRLKARSVGKTCWRIECAIDAEVINRAHAPRGRGNKDLQRVGRGASVEEHAKRLGLTPQFIYRNANIHHIFFAASKNTMDVHSIFEAAGTLEKSFFEIALRSPDPISTIKEFAEKKKADPEFTCRDARRQIERAAVELPNIEDIIHAALQSEDAREAWIAYQRAARGVVGHIPFVAGLIRGHLEEMQYELSRPTGTIRQRILDLIGDGFNTLQTLAEMVALPPVICEALLQKLIDGGDLLIEKQGGKTDAARGAKTSLYVLVEK